MRPGRGRCGWRRTERSPGGPFNEAITQLVWDMAARAEEALRRAEERALEIPRTGQSSSTVRGAGRGILREPRPFSRPGERERSTA